MPKMEERCETRKGKAMQESKAMGSAHLKLGRN